MDAAQLTVFLSPFLPFLTKPDRIDITSVAEQLGEAQWHQAQRIWTLLYPKLEAKEAAKEAVMDVAHHPHDEDLQVSLRVQLKKLLTQDSDLAAAITKIFQAASAASSSSVHVTQTVSGNQNQVIGQMSGGTLIGSMQGPTFNISDSTVTNLTGQGNISYHEASAPIQNPASPAQFNRVPNPVADERPGHETPVSPTNQPVTIFFSYSHKDEELRDELAKHLSILERNGIIAGWHDRRIVPGEEWANEIDEWMDTAQVILLLISSDFIASDYCWNIEVKRAMERHETGEAIVIPIILRPVSWENAPFGRLQALPKNAQPVTVWNSQDQAFLNISQGIEAVVKRSIMRHTA